MVLGETFLKYNEGHTVSSYSEFKKENKLVDSFAYNTLWCCHLPIMKIVSVLTINVGYYWRVRHEFYYFERSYDQNPLPTTITSCSIFNKYKYKEPKHRIYMNLNPLVEKSY